MSSSPGTRSMARLGQCAARFRAPIPLASKKRVVDIVPLSSDLDAPGSRFEPVKVAMACALRALRRRTGAKNVKKECTRSDLTT